MYYEKFKTDFLEWIFSDIKVFGETSKDWYDFMTYDVLFELTQYLHNVECRKLFMDSRYTVESREKGFDFFDRFEHEVLSELEHRDWVVENYGVKGLHFYHR